MKASHGSGSSFSPVRWFGSVVPSDAGQALRGRILDSHGNPVAGAIMTANDRATAHTTSVYSDRGGHYAFADLSAASYELRARHFGSATGEARRQAGGRPVDVMLETETDEYERVAALPSNRWFALALAAMPNDTMREEFERQCTFCHQQGSWATRVQRTPEHWQKIFSLMARMGGSSHRRRALRCPAS